jgi:thioesterase domain-containing protein
VSDATVRLAAALAREIPLSRALGIAVTSWDGRTVRLSAPLAPNVNHTATVFGGSLSAAATLAGWSALWLLLDARGLAHQVVIQDATIAYRHAVTDDFTVTCSLPDAADVERFLATLASHGRARLRLVATVSFGERELVRFEGRYVALRPQPVEDR